MTINYSSERNVQMLLSLMKAHQIRKVVVSPGATNMCLVGSLQHDPYFELYSSIDERSAAYLACGMAAECGEPVALSCTGATAARNYMSGMTEAFYRKLPVLAISSSRHTGQVGQGFDQQTDRSAPPPDTQRMSVCIPAIQSKNDEWAYNVKINMALLELRRRGGGPVHINLVTGYSSDFSVKELPQERAIHRVCLEDTFPTLPAGKIGIFVGAHTRFSTALTKSIDAFCAEHDAVVFCDHCSNYHGKYRAFCSLVTSQQRENVSARYLDTLIHIGEVAVGKMWLKAKHVWRVSPDGEVRDPFRSLEYIFEMSEQTFFDSYTADEKTVGQERNSGHLTVWNNLCREYASRIPELPFSNIWIAQHTAHLLPQNSILHLGILNSAVSWNFFEAPGVVSSYVNTGGYGIDGCVSSLIGGSLAKPECIHFGFVGDLAFFYDMNSLGNRHIGSNVRLMVINNGMGAEFRLYKSGYQKSGFGDKADAYAAAAGHFGNKSRSLVKHYAGDLGFEYLSAENKREYLENIPRFISKDLGDKPMIFEVFTDPDNESDAMKIIRNL